jgi:predicted amino acid-binding ACT domain protein
MELTIAEGEVNIGEVTKTEKKNSLSIVTQVNIRETKKSIQVCTNILATSRESKLYSLHGKYSEI